MLRPGLILKETRKRKGVTQQQLAAAAGTTQSAISRIEKDHISPAVSTLDSLLGVLGERLILGVGPSATFLVPDHPAWDGLDAEERQALRPDPKATVEELLRRGAALSAQAARLRRSLLSDPGAGS